MMRTGGCGGFFASVRDMGVAGQQQHPIKDSAELAIRGGGGGFFISRGGATNPGSPVPSPEMRVPVQSVAARAADMTFLFVAGFMSYIVLLGRNWFIGGGKLATGETLVSLTGAERQPRPSFVRRATEHSLYAT